MDEAPNDVALIPMPMFPLSTVLLPGAAFPLHIFEPRYRQLAEECTRDRSEFGVVLIKRGSEVGGDDVRFAVATLARVVEAAQFPDGRWLLATTGTSRIRIHTWLPDDPYPMALVERLNERPLDIVDQPKLVEAQRYVTAVLTLGEALNLTTAVVPEMSDDLAQATWDLAAASPMNAIDQQRLLETEEPAERLDLLLKVLEDVEAVFRFQLND